jgi:nucleoside-diphosphate-sugar epimerase
MTEPAAAGELFNVACGERFSLNELVRTIGEIVGTDITPRYAEPRTGDVDHSMADITRAREVLAYEPLVSFEEGLRRTVEYMADRAVAGSPAP